MARIKSIEAFKSRVQKVVNEGAGLKQDKGINWLLRDSGVNGVRLASQLEARSPELVQKLDLLIEKRYAEEYSDPSHAEHAIWAETIMPRYEGTYQWPPLKPRRRRKRSKKAKAMHSDAVTGVLDEVIHATLNGTKHSALDMGMPLEMDELFSHAEEHPEPGKTSSRYTPKPKRKRMGRK